MLPDSEAPLSSKQKQSIQTYFPRMLLFLLHASVDFVLHIFTLRSHTKSCRPISSPRPSIQQADRCGDCNYQHTSPSVMLARQDTYSSALYISSSQKYFPKPLPLLSHNFRKPIFLLMELATNNYLTGGQYYPQVYHNCAAGITLVRARITQSFDINNTSYSDGLMSQWSKKIKSLWTHKFGKQARQG